jgi:hypothetical protein
MKFNSIQFNSIQFNSIQFNSIQFNSIQFLLLLTLFIGCSKESNSLTSEFNIKPKNELIEKIKVANSHLVFESYDHFFEVIDLINSKRETIEELSFNKFISASDALNPKNTCFSDEVVSNRDDCDFPEPYLYILNKDFEVQIGNTVSLYHHKNKYFVPIGQEEKLAEIRAGIRNDVVAYEFGKIKKVEPQSLVGILAGDQDYRWSGSNKSIRFYHALAHWVDYISNYETRVEFGGTSVVIANGPAYKSLLALHVNMVQNQWGNWPSSTLGREVLVKVFGNATMINQVYSGGGPVYVEPIGNLIQFSIDLPNQVRFSETSFILASSPISRMNNIDISSWINVLKGFDTHWRVNVSGTIRQFIPNVPEFKTTGQLW